MSDSSIFSPQTSFCSRCGEQHQVTANFCPRCAMPVQSQFDSANNPVNASPTRKVGVGLGVGILLLPYIFSWFTLRQGHTTLAKTLSFIWLGLFALGWATRSNEPKSSYAGASQSISSNSYQTNSNTTESPKQDLLRKVTIDFKWTKGGFGSIMIADFTITNLSDYPVKDLDVTCNHFANSGTKIDSNSRTIYETVPAKGKKVVKDFNMGFIHSQAARSSCEITDLQVVQ